MSRRTIQHVTALAQRAGRHTASKTQASVYLEMKRDRAQSLVSNMFPTKGKKSAEKMARIVSHFKN